MLLRADVLEMVFPAFAALDLDSDRRQLQHYKAWVQKLATRDYADELVISAVAHEFQVQITCVPRTPETSSEPWAISVYKPPAPVDAPLPCVLLGNNDVHFMHLHGAS